MLLVGPASPMRILFLHNNFPGQYRRIVNRLHNRKGYELLSASLASNKQPAPFKRLGYTPHRKASKDIHPAIHYTEETVVMGQAVMKTLLPVKNSGWKPDIVLSHSGWGPSLFVKDIWPDTRHLSYFEWYYQAEGSDTGFLNPKEADDYNFRMRIRMKNTAMLHDLASMDWGQCPTEYQLSTFPEIFHDRISVLHDGVDTDFFSPADNTSFTIGEHVFRKGDPLVTYIARGMEPYRGFPQFIEAVSRLQKINPHVHVAVIGEDRVAYGAKRKDGKTWKQAALEEFQPDLTRLHFLGNQPLNVLRDVLRVSAAHVYLTVPFVLSWSMMESMSAGALLVASDTPPVRELIQDGHNGLLVPFFEPDSLAQKLSEVLDAPESYSKIRAEARKTIFARYHLSETVERYLKLIETVASGQRPLKV